MNMYTQVLQETLPSRRRGGGAKYSPVLAADEAAEEGLEPRGTGGGSRQLGAAGDCGAAAGHQVDRLSIAVQAEQPPGGSCCHGSCSIGLFDWRGEPVLPCDWVPDRTITCDLKERRVPSSPQALLWRDSGHCRQRDRLRLAIEGPGSREGFACLTRAGR